MKVEIFRNTVKRRGVGHSYDMLFAWKKGIEAVGDQVIWREGKPDVAEWCGEPTTDCCIMFGYGGKTALNHLKGNRRKIREAQEARGKKVITYDGGLFSSFNNNPARGNKLVFRIAFSSPMRNGNFLNANSPADRWEKIKKNYNIQYNAWRTQGKHILLCTQPQDNWSMDQMCPFTWAEKTVNEIRTHTDRPIRLRPHPNHVDKCFYEMKKRKVDIDFCDLKERSVFRWNFLDECKGAWAMVTHNSTASVDSATYGIPTFVTSDLAMSYPVANTDLSKIESPNMPDRDQWLHDLGYANWSMHEVENGTVWRRFREHI